MIECVCVRVCVFVMVCVWHECVRIHVCEYFTCVIKKATKVEHYLECMPSLLNRDKYFTSTHTNIPICTTFGHSHNTSSGQWLSSPCQHLVSYAR